MCTKIMDGGIPLKHFGCMVVTYCLTGGTPTSSIGPLGIGVNAYDKTGAINGREGD
ncbi:MAG: hypothetical protein HQK50_03545 [Oligoflexia bacterium]|nr:hypothetical protein [Oligoflexia bacterium]MBF0364617.1 hypothetical protein [Oligoflexia bacterium]